MTDQPHELDGIGIPLRHLQPGDRLLVTIGPAKATGVPSGKVEPRHVLFHLIRDRAWVSKDVDLALVLAAQGPSTFLGDVLQYLGNKADAKTKAHAEEAVRRRDRR